MRHASFLSVFFAFSTLAFAGCGGSSQSKKNEQKAGGATKKDTGQTTSGGIELSGLEFGPYLAKAPDGFGTRQVSVEFGFLDVREQKDGDKQDIADYRFKQAAVYVQDSHLPDKAASGCAPVTKPQGGANPAKAVVFAGGAHGEKSFASGLAKVEGKDDEITFDPGEPLTATIKGLAGADVEVKTPEMPTAAAIQLAGAIDANVTVNTMVADINKTLSEAKDDLLIGDVGTAKNYDMIVVTLYPSEDAAEPTPVRCFLEPNGSATLSRAKYAKLLPLRGIIGHFAHIDVTTKDGVTVWAASFAGQGAEDLTVK